MNEDGVQIETLQSIDTPTLANGIEKLKLRNNTDGFCSRAIKCMFPEKGVMCGYAVTAKVETINPDSAGGLDSVFIELCRACEVSTKPVVVVMQETSDYPERSAHCGEVMATTFKKLGVIGVVSDSAVRDIQEVKTVGLHYFAPGAVASHGSFRIVDVQIAVNICGLEIHPGDILHGDINGLITVPPVNDDEIKTQVEQVRIKEKVIMDYIKGHDFSVDGLKDVISH